jgi:eukaryotic-like serine/threonine-protein kinase
MGQPFQLGRYTLHAELAAGGMAAVYLARQSGAVGFGKTVAIKRLHPHLARDQYFVTMFLDEARLCARIRHPNVVTTLDVVTGKGQLLLVMEYVPGESLARLCKGARAANQPVPLPIAVSVITGALHGLHAAHEAHGEDGTPLGIVHRDVSPQNILVGVDGIARVLDFGIAKARGRLHTTQDGKVKGKFAYMSPEQVRATPLDRRSDVFAASVMLWELLTGRRLFDAENEAAMVGKVLLDELEPPSRYRPEVSAELDAIVMAGLAREREERIQTAREMAVRLEKAVGLAPPADVGEWVEANAREVLETRAKRVEEIESGVEPPPPSSVQDMVEELISDPELSETLSSSPLRAGEPVSSLTTTTATVTSPTVRGTARSPSAAPAANEAGASRRVGVGTVVAFSAGALVVGLTAAFVARPWNKGAAPVVAAPPPVTATASAAPAAPEAPPVATIAVTLAATPPAAQIYLDDVLVDGNPYVTTAPKGSSVHRVRAELAGYTARETSVTFDDEVSVKLDLARQARPGGHVVTKEGPAKARSIDVNDPYAK